MALEIIIGVAIGILTIMFGMIMANIRAMRVQQFREQEYRYCELQAMDYAIEQLHDGEYATVRDKKKKQYMESLDFKRQTA